MKYLDILKKFDNAIVAENKKLSSIYSKLIKESKEDEIKETDEEKLKEKCCDEADKDLDENDKEEVKECGDKDNLKEADDEKKVDEADDEVKEAEKDEQVDESIKAFAKSSKRLFKETK